MSKIRECFTSRFTNGHLMEFDFSQLEVIALAHLTQDGQLIADITAGVDMHVVSAAKMYRVSEILVTPSMRKIAKSLSFQLQYGAGYKSMAKQCKVSEELAKAFIAAYYDRYPRVKEWQDRNIAIAASNRTLPKDHGRTKNGLPQGISTLLSDTGRRYVFKEYDSPAWKRGEPTGFSPTEIKNYAVQGFATGDIVPMVLGKVYRALKSESEDINDNIKMINTVHDSIVFDVANRYEQACYDIVYPVMMDVPRYLHDDFAIDFTLPINVDCEIGETWADMEKYKL